MPEKPVRTGSKGEKVMGKTWDTEKIEKFTESVAAAYDKYTDDSHLLEDGFAKYYYNDTYRGQAAETSKNFIGDGQNNLHFKQHDIQKRLVYKYYDMIDSFKDKVDPSPIARIDTDILDSIKKDFKVFYNVTDVEGYAIERKARYIMSKFGKYNGNFNLPNYRIEGEMYEDLCGAGGFLDKCIRMFEEFDEEMCTNIDQSGIENDVDELQNKIVTTASALDAIQVIVENMPKFSFGLISLSVNAINTDNQKELRKKAKDIYISKLLGKLNGTGFHGTYERSFVVKDSNRVRIGSVNQSFVTVTGVPDSDGNLTTTYGGAQAWFMKDPDYKNKLSDFGCGSIASVNQYLYLTGQTTISYDDYRQLVYDFVDAKDQPAALQGIQSIARKTTLYTIDGFAPNQMTGYVTNMCKSKGVTISSHWDYFKDYEDDYQSMKEQLNKGVPVIWAVNDFENMAKDSKDLTKVGVSFYKYDDKNGQYYISAEKVTSHYVTATAIYEDTDEAGKTRRLVEISSWGNKYYVDYDQYIDIVRSDTDNEPCSSITHTTVK